MKFAADRILVIDIVFWAPPHGSPNHGPSETCEIDMNIPNRSQTMKCFLSLVGHTIHNNLFSSSPSASH